MHGKTGESEALQTAIDTAYALLESAANPTHQRAAVHRELKVARHRATSIRGHLVGQAARIGIRAGMFGGTVAVGAPASAPTASHPIHRQRGLALLGVCQCCSWLWIGTATAVFDVGHSAPLLRRVVVRRRRRLPGTYDRLTSTYAAQRPWRRPSLHIGQTQQRHPPAHA